MRGRASSVTDNVRQR